MYTVILQNPKLLINIKEKKKRTGRITARAQNTETKPFLSFLHLSSSPLALSG
uniref:Uncharacterized protein n=1 Tax=Rhizophora mucronata TaxID=61149 RepID=A0A2P2Q965_RHIMU